MTAAAAGMLHRLWFWPPGAQVGALQWLGLGLWQEGTQGSQRCSCLLLCTFTVAVGRGKWRGGLGLFRLTSTHKPMVRSKIFALPKPGRQRTLCSSVLLPTMCPVLCPGPSCSDRQDVQTMGPGDWL